MHSPIFSTLNYILQTVVGLYILAVLLRLLLQLVRADFYNPISQFIVKATNPLLVPLRRVVPSVGGVDTASLTLAFIIQILLLYIIAAFDGISPADLSVFAVVFTALLCLIAAILKFYFFALIIIAIASWIAPGNYNPAMIILRQITDPVTNIVRRVIPPMGGLDLSVMVVILAIFFIEQGLLVSLASINSEVLSLSIRSVVMPLR
ncbi:YggT family protein [Zooshikella ganghwensis]|uniref:YggT family protein n=1 Tax=Zooshikella ganghwensis TaxID=202772 RepID=UPI000401072D|nr:YggT family protein [Zooshikella ganghwensis]